MTINQISSLGKVASYPFTCLQSRLTSRYPVAYVASVAVALLGSFFLYRHFSSSTPPLTTTHLNSYVVVTPRPGGPFGREKSREEMQGLYEQAKKIIASLPEEFSSKVDFDDRNLEMGFKYDAHTLRSIANHDQLWFIFSAEETFKPFHRSSIFDSDSNRFSIKNLGQANLQQFKEVKELEEKAENFFKNQAVIKTIPDFDEWHFDDCTALVSAIFRKSKGLSLGDMHRSIAPKYFLISQMQTFVNHNVEVLFMEGLYESQQADLDAYFDPKTSVEALPLSIRYRFGYLEEILRSKGGYTMVDIIMAAKRAGIKRIVAIDTLLSHDDHRLRCLTMNYFANPIIDKEMPEGNYVIFSGLSHAASDDETNIPSFSQLFGIPSICVYSSRILMMICNEHNEKMPLPLVDNPHATVRCNFSVGIPEGQCKKLEQS